MARIFQTGFETGIEPTVDFGSGWGTATSSGTRGAWSAYCLGHSTQVCSYAFTASAGEIYFGIGLSHGTVPNDNIIAFRSPNAVTNVYLFFDSTQHVQARRGDDTVLGTSSFTYPVTSTWYYLTGHIVISDSVGVVSLSKDGVNGLSLTSQDTRNDAGANGDKVDRIQLKPYNSPMDDIWVNDTTGSQNTADSGDVRISAYIPNDVGDVTGMTPTSGANWSNVDERPPNDATDLVAASGTSLYDLYNIPNTVGVATVQAVTLWLRAQKSDAGAKNVAHVIKSGSTENVGSDVPLSTSWTYYGKLYNVDPTDSAAWTPSKINSLQIGQKAR